MNGNDNIIGYRLDGEPVDFDEFLRANVEDTETCAAARALRPGESVTFGGGAAATFVLSRDARDVSRFDLYPTVRLALNAAVELRLIDAAEAFCLGARHGLDAKAVLAELVEIAFANRHAESPGKSVHAIMCDYNDMLAATLRGERRV